MYDTEFIKFVIMLVIASMIVGMAAGAVIFN